MKRKNFTLSLIGFGLVLGLGCAPQEDFAYLSDSDLAAAEMDAAKMNPIADEDDNDDNNDDNNAMIVKKDVENVNVQPPVVAEVEVVQLPDTYVREPSIVEPTTLINTKSESNVEVARDIYHLRNKFSRTHMHNHHNEHTNITNNHKFQTNNIFQSTDSRSFSRTSSVVNTVEVLPDTSTVLAGVTTTLVGSYYPSLYSAYFCHPYYGGRFWNYCRGAFGLLP